MALVLPHDLVNLTPADASALQANFSAIETYVNSELLDRSGTIAMVNGLLLPGNPTETNQAANKGYVDAVVPVGWVNMWAGTTEPSNYMFCRGQAISRGTYSLLFTVIGTNYGVGDGSSTFNLPDMRGRYPFGHNEGGTYGQVGVGQVFGNKDLALNAHTHVAPDHLHALGGTTLNENQNHTHPMRGTADTSAAGGFGEGNIADASNVGFGVFANTGTQSVAHTHNLPSTTGASDRVLTTTSTGSGDGVNGNLPPTQSLNFIIKVL